MNRISSVVASLRAGVSPVCEAVPPRADEFGVLVLSAITAGDINRTRAKRLEEARVKSEWPTIRRGTILVSRASGSRDLVGACVLVEKDEPKLIPPDTAWVIDVMDGHSARALIEYLRSPKGRKAIREISRGSNGTWKISQRSFLSLQLPIFNDETEQRIESLSTTFDEHFSSLGAILDEKRKLKLGLAQNLLSGKKRFTNFNDKEWIEAQLGEIFVERNEVGRDELQLLSVTNDRGVIPRKELEKRDTSNPDKSKYKRVAVGDIPYNTMRMWQGASALSPLEGIVSPAYTVVVPTTRIDGAFAKHLFKFAPVVHMFHRHSQGLVDDTLNLKYNRFAKIRLRIPADVKEQERIAAILDLCDLELALLAEEYEQLELYKRSVLTRLLSGEIPEVA